MIITLSGPPGSGKSTVAKMLAKKISFERHYIGGIQRGIAKKHGLTIDEYNLLSATNPSYDKDIEDYIEKLGKEQDNFIIESRTAFHFIPHSLKIYLDVSLDEGAKRVFTDKKERNEKIKHSIKETIQDIKKRMNNETKRYRKFYNIDCHNKENYDLVIDSTNISPEEVVEKILKAAKSI